jgi:hypothetical protein
MALLRLEALRKRSREKDGSHYLCNSISTNQQRSGQHPGAAASARVNSFYACCLPAFLKGWTACSTTPSACFSARYFSGHDALPAKTNLPMKEDLKE